MDQLHDLSNLVLKADADMRDLEREAVRLDEALKRANNELRASQAEQQEAKSLLAKTLGRHQDFHSQLNQSVARLSTKKQQVRLLFIFVSAHVFLRCSSSPSETRRCVTRSPRQSKCMRFRMWLLLIVLCPGSTFRSN